MRLNDSDVKSAVLSEKEKITVKATVRETLRETPSATTSTSTAIAKAILLGEHSVVYGEPALAVPVKSASLSVSVSKSDKEMIMSSLKLSKWQKSKVKEIISFLSSSFRMRFLTKVIIDSDIPLGSGMGSSAALSVALIRAFSGLLGKKLSITEVNDLAFVCERHFHGSPSGIDNLVISSERPVIMNRNRLSFFNIPKGIRLLIADSGEKSSTKRIVSDVNTLIKKRGYSMIKKIGAISEEGINALERRDLRKFGKMMTLNHEALKDIGVSSEKIDKMVEAAIDAGSLGAKVSGAGKGGIMIALVDTSSKYLFGNKKRIDSSISRIKGSLENAGAKAVWEVSF